MSVGNMTVLKKHSQAGVLPPTTSDSSTKMVSSRGAALNPEASVFCLPNLGQRSSSNGTTQDENVHLFMNGDVSKKSCGEISPPSDPLRQEMSERDSHDTKSDEPAQKMTDPVPASHDEMLGSPKVPQQHSAEKADCPEEPTDGKVPEDEAPQKRLEPVLHQGDDGNDDTGQGVESSSTETLQSTQPSKEPLTRDQIKEMVSQSVEYFFSRENWSSDPYLLSQMDSDQYVPVYILANCSQFKSITKDHSIILDVLKESVFVQLDEEKNRVRPNYKRCIVILREISKLTPVEEIEAMFEGDGCPKSISCEFVHNDVWYVTFESDSDAQNAYKYLRETVKTFQDKPILARIKTKTVSRIDCLSVLPSYGGKGHGEVGDRMQHPIGPGGGPNHCIPPGGPQVGPGMQGVPNPPPPPPHNAYPPNNPARMFYPPQGNMNASYPNYNFTGSIPIPTAYFYPNPMMQWQAPNFYDINSFIQYNGLSPRATYKPPTNLRFANNNNNNINNGNNNSANNRRAKPTKQPDQRHMSGGGGGYNGNGQTRPNHACVSRPQSALSPHAYSQSAGQAASHTHHSVAGHAQPANLPEGECRSVSSTDPNTNNNNTNSNSSSSISTNRLNTIPTSTESFAQSDHSFTSQSNNSYNSCTIPPGANATQGNVRTEVDDPDTSANTSTQTSVPPPPKSEGTPVSSDITPSTSSSSTSTSAVTDSSPCLSQSSLAQGVVLQPPTSSHSPPDASQHHPHAHSHPGNTLHRSSNFNGDGAPVRDSQPQRQMTRGGRRRISRRDEESNGPSSGGNRGSLRGSAESSVRNHETKKPSFELQATSFPPLPSAEEPVVVAPEEKSLDATATPTWAVETHKFSDVMKGTAKPKPISTESESEPATDTSAKSGERLSTTSQAPPPPDFIPVHAASPHKASEPTVPSSVGRLERGVRGGGSLRGIGGSAVQGVRRELGGRGGLRRDRDGAPLRLSSNKENNRPQSRSWRDERPDADGWITKTPRDTRNHRESRYQNAHNQNNQFHHHQQQSYSDNRSTKPQPMVNGDHSPPPSPQEVFNVERSEIVNHSENNSTLPAADSKTNGKTETKLPVAETVTEKEPVSNNAEGEHKTSWAKMALASKDQMERLSAELKEKEEQERLRKIRTTKPPPKLPERASIPGRERDGKPFRRGDVFFPRDRKEDREFSERGGGRDFRSGPPPSERPPSFALRTPREALAPKSPK